MKQLILVVIAVCCFSTPAFAASSIVHSIKIPVVQKSIYFEPLVDFQLVKSPVKTKLVDETMALVEVLEKYPTQDTVSVDGDFHVHTKMTLDTDETTKKLLVVEGSVATLGFVGYDTLKNRYLIKGDYQFNLDLSELMTKETKTFYISGTIPLKLIDTSSGQDYYVYTDVEIGCSVEKGCADARVQFIKTSSIPVKEEL